MLFLSGFIMTDHNHVRRGCHYHVRRGYVRLYESWFDSMSRWFDHELPQPRPPWLWLPRPFPLTRQVPAVQVRRFTFMGEREVITPCVGVNRNVCMYVER